MVGSCGSAIGAEQLTFMVMSPTGDMSVYVEVPEVHLLFFPGKGAAFGKAAESQLDQRKYLEV